VEDAELVLDGRIGDGRRLQAVAQRLVVELDLPRRPRGLLAFDVPVVDEVLEVLRHQPAQFNAPRNIRASEGSA
jgi:hypothetical protein